MECQRHHDSSVACEMAERKTPKIDSPKSSTVTPEMFSNPKANPNPNMEAKECAFLFTSAFHTHLTAKLPSAVPLKGLQRRTAIPFKVKDLRYIICAQSQRAIGRAGWTLK